MKIDNYGDITCQYDKNGENILTVKNTTSGTAGSSVFRAEYSATQYSLMIQRNPSYTTNGLNVADSMCLISYGNSAGMRIFTEDDTSVIIGTNNTARLTIGGGVGAATFSNNVDAASFSVGSTAGIDTTFVDADGNTITVTKGIITAKTAP